MQEREKATLLGPMVTFTICKMGIKTLASHDRLTGLKHLKCQAQGLAHWVNIQRVLLLALSQNCPAVNPSSVKRELRRKGLLQREGGKGGVSVI